MKTPARDARGELAPIRLPDPALLFGERAARLAALSPGHAAAPFLELLARLARAQEAALREVRTAPGLALSAGERPLDPSRLPRDGSWRAMLRVVLGGARAVPLPNEARDAIARLGAASERELDALADDALSGAPRDLSAAPFVGAALQAYFTRLAGGLDLRALVPRESGCPACGTGPVAGVVLGIERLRYLACGLCATEWHVPRVQCASCRATAGITYLELEPSAGGARVEVCEGCRAAVKLFDRERVQLAEPCADDAASLVLDLLVGERGYHRAGPNLLAPIGRA